MKSDEEIERERAALEPLIGPTRGKWYAEACKVEWDAPHGELLWACRYRELAMALGQMEQSAKAIRAALKPVVDLINKDAWKDK